MSLAKAHQFILQIAEDEALRGDLNAAPNREEFVGLLTSRVGTFSMDDFEEAFNALHVRCRDASQAAELHELRLWWHLLVAAVARQ